jgi:hypothetical protein
MFWLCLIFDQKTLVPLLNHEFQNVFNFIVNFAFVSHRFSLILYYDILKNMMVETTCMCHTLPELILFTPCLFNDALNYSDKIREYDFEWRKGSGRALL